MKVKLNNKFNFVVAGGGTAGWICALWVKHYFPETNVTVIENPEIGVIGVGESTTPHFFSMINELGISIEDFITNTQSTFKNAIKFTNWNGDNKHYYHGFSQDPNVSWHSMGPDYCVPSMRALEIIKNDKTDILNSIDLTSQACEHNRVRYSPNSQFISKPQTDSPVNRFKSHGNHALHIDGVLTSSYFKKIGLTRGIQVIDGTISKINNDKNEYIKSIELKDKTIVSCDFVFDCTGFKRLIIGKHYKSEWESYKEHLPVNKAITFSQPLMPEVIPPYTEAVAMKYGWVWKTPLQHRSGCGYVFDSSYINEDQAKAELNEYFGDSIKIGKTVSFEAGTYKNIWTKNCIAVGLASGFIEPLESTSIMTTILTLCSFLRHLDGLDDDNERARKIFNKTVNNITNSVLTFVCFHYYTKRADTEFWRDFRKKNKPPIGLQKIINDNNSILTLHKSYSYEESLNGAFSLYSWDQVGIGIGFYNKDEATNIFNAYNTGHRRDMLESLKLQHEINTSRMLPSLVNHKVFLKHLIKK